MTETAILVVLLVFIICQQRIIMTQQDEAAVRLNAVADQLSKVQTEIQALKDVAAGEAGGVSAALAAAIDRVAIAAQVTDDMNIDASAPSTS